MQEHNLKKHIESLFKDTKFSDGNNNLFTNTILEAIEKIDDSFVEILLKDEKAKKHFFSKVLDTYVMNQFKLIDFFSMNNYFEESYTSYTNKIGLIRKDDFIKKNNDVVLAFPYKDCVLEGGQTKDDQKGKENFFNEILDSDEIDRLFEPKVLTNIKRYSKDGIEENPTISEKDNLILKGNNLLALHSLNKKYAGKVKLIYIDPPYNTGSDSFGYNDNFNHSTWLTFMKNRLEVAKEMLSSDGVLLIQSSFHEFVYLRVLMDEIFNKHLCDLNIQVRHPDRSLTGDKEFNDVIEYISIYSDNSNKKMPFIEEKKTVNDYVLNIDINDKKPITTIDCEGKLVEVYLPSQYTINKVLPSNIALKSISIRGSIREKNSSGRFFVKHLEGLKEDYPPRTLFKVPNMGDDSSGYRYFYSAPKGNKNGGYYQGMPTSSDTTRKQYSNFYNFEKEYNTVSKEGDVLFRNGKKPEELLQFLIGMFSNVGDMVVDFHLGSGTTCAVAHKMGRQYIGIEQMDYIQDITVERMKKVIDGEQGGISKSVNWQGGCDFVYAELKQVSHFDNADKKLKQEMRYLPIGELEDKDYSISKEEIAINKAFYGVDDE